MDKDSLKIIITDCFDNGKIVFLTLSDGSTLNLIKKPVFFDTYLFFKVDFEDVDGESMMEEFYIPYSEVKYLASGYPENYDFGLEAI